MFRTVALCVISMASALQSKWINSDYFSPVTSSSKPVTGIKYIVYMIYIIPITLVITIPNRISADSIWNCNTRHGGRARNAEHFVRQNEAEYAIGRKIGGS